MLFSMFRLRKQQVIIATLLVALLAGCSTVPRPNVHIPKHEPPHKPIKNVKVALVLGSGGARGLAHLGVLEVLEEHRIPVDLIIGSSAGSIIGSLYADNPDALAIKKKVINLKRKDLLDLSVKALFQGIFRLKGPIQGNALEAFMVKELKAKTFDELKIPFIAVATNVKINRLVPLRSGPIAPAVHASSALPPLFTPVELYHHLLVDGGVIAPVPVQVARQFKPKIVIAVDISTPPSKSELYNAFELLYRALHISFYELSRMQSTKADVNIHPNLAGYGTFDEEYNLEFYEIGRKAALAKVEEIKSLLAKQGISLKADRTYELSQVPNSSSGRRPFGMNGMGGFGVIGSKIQLRLKNAFDSLGIKKVSSTSGKDRSKHVVSKHVIRDQSKNLGNCPGY